MLSAIASPSSNSSEIAPFLMEAASASAVNRPGGQKYPVIIIALDRAAELVDLRAADRILPPTLRLKSRANRDNALSEQAEAVDPAVCTSTVTSSCS